MGERLDIGGDYRTIQQIVTDKIRNAILDATLRPNERLNQSDLAQKLNVSRIPTREALRTLEAEGLVKFTRIAARHGFGHVACDEIEEVYEIRTLLEISAAQRALFRIDSAQLQVIRNLQAKMQRATNPELWISLNQEFHHAIYEPSGWTRLLSVIDMLRNLTAPYLRLYISDRWERKTAISEHAAIVRAIEAKKAGALKSTLRRHLSHSCQGILTHLKRTGTGTQLDMGRGSRPRKMTPRQALDATPRVQRSKK